MSCSSPMLSVTTSTRRPGRQLQIHLVRAALLGCIGDHYRVGKVGRRRTLVHLYLAGKRFLAYRAGQLLHQLPDLLHRSVQEDHVVRVVRGLAHYGPIGPLEPRTQLPPTLSLGVLEIIFVTPVLLARGGRRWNGLVGVRYARATSPWLDGDLTYLTRLIERTGITAHRRA